MRSTIVYFFLPFVVLCVFWWNNCHQIRECPGVTMGGKGPAVMRLKKKVMLFHRQDYVFNVKRLIF